jgi:hypothetical protein
MERKSQSNPVEIIYLSFTENKLKMKIFTFQKWFQRYITEKNSPKEKRRWQGNGGKFEKVARNVWQAEKKYCFSERKKILRHFFSVIFSDCYFFQWNFRSF